MVIGNPYDFAINLQRIDLWNINDETNYGIFLFMLNGIVFPSVIENLDTIGELSLLTEKLSNIAEDEVLFSMEKRKAVMEMYNITYPSDINYDNDYRFNITPEEIADRGYFIFAVCDKNSVRVLATSRLEYDKNESVHKFNNMEVYETILSISEIDKMVKESRKYLE